MQLTLEIFLNLEQYLDFDEKYFLLRFAPIGLS